MSLMGPSLTCYMTELCTGLSKVGGMAGGLASSLWLKAGLAYIRLPRTSARPVLKYSKDADSTAYDLAYPCGSFFPDMTAIALFTFSLLFLICFLCTSEKSLTQISL